MGLLKLDKEGDDPGAPIARVGSGAEKFNMIPENAALYLD